MALVEVRELVKWYTTDGPNAVDGISFEPKVNRVVGLSMGMAALGGAWYPLETAPLSTGRLCRSSRFPGSRVPTPTCWPVVPTWQASCLKPEYSWALRSCLWQSE